MNEQANLSNIIADVISQWETTYIEPVIFGTSDPEQIFEQVNKFCVDRLHSSIAHVLFYESSQGAVFGLELADARRVVVKAHQSSRSPEFLQVVYRVQRHLVQMGYPCPTPVIAPKPLGHGFALVEELVDVGEYADANNPHIRREMAKMLFKLIDLTRTFTNLPGWQPGLLDTTASNKLWPTPHSQLFNFEATTAGAEWIDAYARRAKQVLLYAAGTEVIGHTEWSIKHFRFVDGTTSVIYDWDSLALEKEAVIVGNAARCYISTWHFDKPQAPTPDDARAFVADYEAARGSSFTQTERHMLAASATYAIAYTARCEHCLDLKASTFPIGSFREVLSLYGEEFLSL